ncbi:hypothetical protein EGJ09_10655 [Pseudomonas sp. p106]|nr:hypothetical protein EGJ09_10655 [Pseudomonas sp. p106]
MSLAAPSADAEFARRGIAFAVLHATETGKPVHEQTGWTGTSEMAESIFLMVTAPGSRSPSSCFE